MDSQLRYGLGYVSAWLFFEDLEARPVLAYPNDVISIGNKHPRVPGSWQTLRGTLSLPQGSFFP
jgi:hypothetical protein